MPKAVTYCRASESLADCRFTRAARLTRRTQFEQLLRSGGRVRMGPVELRFASADADAARLGLVVGRRAARLATQRNRLKRLMRESFRNRRANLPIVDVVARLTRPVRDEAELAESLDAAWQRLERVGR